MLSIPCLKFCEEVDINLHKEKNYNQKTKKLLKTTLWGHQLHREINVKLETPK